jgi:hypothetical protein
MIDKMPNRNDEENNNASNKCFIEIFSKIYGIHQNNQDILKNENGKFFAKSLSFTGICQNLGKAVPISTNSHSKTRYYILPIFNTNINRIQHAH